MAPQAAKMLPHCPKMDLNSDYVSVSFGPFASALSLGIFRLGSFAWEVPFGTFRLGSFAWDLSPVILSLETFTWDFSRESSRLDSSARKKSFAI